jgi:hypothetical protein
LRSMEQLRRSSLSRILEAIKETKRERNLVLFKQLNFTSHVLRASKIGSEPALLLRMKYQTAQVRNTLN